jgi:lipopolysaccharide transport system permease protein
VEPADKIAGRNGIVQGRMNLQRGIYFELLQAWTRRIIQARYQQSLLGGLWAIIQPGAQALMFSIVFTQAIRVDTGNIPYLLFSYVAMVPWSFFAGSLTDMVGSQVDNLNLVTKIYFPREILPMAGLLARLLDFAIAMGLFVLLALFFHLPLFSLAWIYLPVILTIQVMLALGIGLIGAALNVFYRDIKHLLALGLQLWLYASPVIYPVSVVPERLRAFYFLNPMAGIIESYRAVLLNGNAPEPYLILAGLIAFGTLLVGYWFFKRVEFQFADVI